MRHPIGSRAGLASASKEVLFDATPGDEIFRSVQPKETFVSLILVIDDDIHESLNHGHSLLRHSRLDTIDFITLPIFNLLLCVMADEDASHRQIEQSHDAGFE